MPVLQFVEGNGLPLVRVTANNSLSFGVQLEAAPDLGVAATAGKLVEWGAALLVAANTGGCFEFIDG